MEALPRDIIHWGLDGVNVPFGGFACRTAVHTGTNNADSSIPLEPCTKPFKIAQRKASRYRLIGQDCFGGFFLLSRRSYVIDELGRLFPVLELCAELVSKFIVWASGHDEQKNVGVGGQSLEQCVFH